MLKSKTGFSKPVMSPAKLKKVLVNSVVFPVYQTSTFIFKNTEQLVDFQKGKPDLYLYTRYGNPTLKAAEDKMALLEGGEAALVLSSGMAAISTAVLTTCSAGQEIIATRNLYGGTMHLFIDLLPRWKIKVRFVDTEKIEEAEKLVSKNTRLLYIESPTNPNLKLVDIHKAARIAKKNNLSLAIDNTFATPVNQKPLQLGCDIVLHSATKYLAGHSDLMAGVIVGKKDYIKKCRETMKILGGCLDPLGAFLLMRGLKTLKIRVEKQNLNAKALAQFLSEHPKISRVFYPGLSSHPQYQLALKQMPGFGGMVCFEVRGGLKNAVRVIDSFKIILNAASLGGVESLASLPVYTSHWGFSASELKKADVTSGMVRISCGIEEQKDLIEDLRQALNKIK